MFTHVYLCFPWLLVHVYTFSRVYLYLHLFTFSYQCLIVFTYVSLCLPLITRVFLCFLCVPLITTVNSCFPVWHYLLVHVCLCLPLFINYVYICLPMLALIYLCLPMFTRVYLCLYCLLVFVYPDLLIFHMLYSCRANPIFSVSKHHFLCASMFRIVFFSWLEWMRPAMFVSVLYCRGSQDPWTYKNWCNECIHYLTIFCVTLL